MAEDKESGELPVPPRDGVKMHTTWPAMIRNWPKTTFCIVGNEFCERFSYSGFRTVLTFYILNVLKFDDSATTIFFNAFTIVAYLTPFLGAILADGYIGKFWTIFSVSIFYAIGQILLAVGSTQDSDSSLHPWLDLSALLVIALGVGGIKPCVSGFGADQFEQGQDRMLSLYFSMFYFTINIGSMISTFVSPLFRAQPCLGQDSCYPLAFGIPAVLMVVATGIFMVGSPWYKKKPPTENVFGEVARLIGGALRNKFSKRNTGPTDHWLEHYLDTHNCENDPKCMALKGTKKKNQHLCQKKQYVADVIALFKIIVMFVPVPIFWSLYDQQGSIWLLQGIQMDCSAFGLLLLPDQMLSINGVLVLLFIPVFQVIVYPIFSKCFKLTPLRKMVAGGWLAALSFLITGFVQLQVNKTLPLLPSPGQSFVSFMNVYDENCTISLWKMDVQKNLIGDPFRLPANTSMVDLPLDDKSTFHIPSGKNSFHVEYDRSSCAGRAPEDVTVDIPDQKVYYVAVGEKGTVSGPAATSKPTDGTGEFSMGITMFTDDNYNGSVCVCRLNTKGFDPAHPCDPRSPADFYYWQADYNEDDRGDFIDVVNQPKAGSDPRSITTYQFKPVKPGKWGLYFLHTMVKNGDLANPSKEETDVNDSGVSFEVNGQGGVYEFVVTGEGEVVTSHNSLHVYQVVQDNQVSILWQIPQIVVITAAEVLFSVTGYELAYSQSAPSMKTVVLSLWLFTTALGSAIIVLITALDIFDNMATQFFAYAGAMFVVICIYALMAQFYFEYRYYVAPKEDDDEEEEADTEVKGSYLNENYSDKLEKKEQLANNGSSPPLPPLILPSPLAVARSAALYSPLSSPMENQPPLDPLLDLTKVTEYADLASAEVTLKIPEITVADAESMTISSEHVIIEAMSYKNMLMTDFFCVGDCVLKVDGTAPDDGAHFKTMMVDLSPCTVVVRRRAFVTAPGAFRIIKAMNVLKLPWMRGFSYQIVNCKKDVWDRFLTMSFGFTAECVTMPGYNTSKFIIQEIDTNTAAEKYFSVGDTLLDIKRDPIKPVLPNAISQFNRIFQGGDDMDVFIERPVSKQAINFTEQLIKNYQLHHPHRRTKNAIMSEDACKIGTNAALYHHLFWKKLAPVSILVEPPVATATPALRRLFRSKCHTKKKTTEDPIATEGTQGEGEDSNKRISIKSDSVQQEISTEVEEGTELEHCGYRFDYANEWENADHEDESERKKSAKAKKSRTNPVREDTRESKSDSKKSKRGLFSFVRPKKQ